MLSAPKLPSQVRTKILEYVREKTSGLYGHNDKLIRKFVARIQYPIQGRARTIPHSATESMNAALDERAGITEAM